MRERWREGLLVWDPEHLVFIDETWAKTNMTRTRGRALRGERLVDYVPHGHWKTSTFVGALRRSGLTAPMVVDGPINGVIFMAMPFLTMHLVVCALSAPPRDRARPQLARAPSSL